LTHSFEECSTLERRGFHLRFLLLNRGPRCHEFLVLKVGLAVGVGVA
jgi:hypothetical protein